MAKNNEDDIEIFMYYCKNHDIKDRGYHSELCIYGVSDDGKNFCLRIDEIKTRIYLEFSQEILTNDWLDVKSILVDLIYNYEDKLNVKLVEKEKLYYYERDESGQKKLYKFVEIYFSSRIGMYSFRKNLTENNRIQKFGPIKIHEIKASTELQFLVKNKLYPCGWIKVSNWKRFLVNDNEKETECDYELVLPNTLITNIKTLEDKSEKPNIKIASWDIEAKCKNISKSPGEDINDCVFQISVIFYEYNSKKVTKFLLTLGTCNIFSDDVSVAMYKTEKDLIIGFRDLINDQRPHIMTGWNIFNFDIKFLKKRAEQTQCLGEFLCMGFSINEPAKIKPKKWQSKAMLTVDIEYIEAEGLIFIDLIEIVRKEYKLDSYSLQNVSKHFLNEQKDDISFKDLMFAYDCFLKQLPNADVELTKTGKYCVQDSMLVLDLFLKIQAWLSLSEMSKTTCTQIFEVHTNGQQTKYYNQIYRYCYFNNIVVEEDGYECLETDRYSGAYVFDPKTGLHEYVVSLDFNSLYPSIIIAYNIDYTTIVKNPKDFDSSELETMEWEDHQGCQHDNLVIQKNIYSDYLAKIKQQLESCNLKKNDKQMYTKLISQQKRYQKERVKLTKKIAKRIICQKNSFSFIKKEIHEGVVPKIIQNLLNARKRVKNEMAKETDPDIKSVLNQKQSSYKICANSMYGAMGVRSGMLPFMPLAMCVTYTGRESIKRAASILRNELNGEIIYGDTDSNYVIFKDVQSETHEDKCKEIWDKAIEAAKYISLKFPNPMNIEFEDAIYYKYFILSKKMYMYISCDQNGTISTKLNKKGVLLSRRDNSQFVKRVYESTVKNIFDAKTKLENIENFINYIYQLNTFQITDDQLVITKSVNDYNDGIVRYNELDKKYYMGSYIVKEENSINSLPAQVQLELNSVNLGEEKSEGSRIEYIVVDRPGFMKQFDKIEKYSNFKINRNVCKPDFLYYVTRLHNPVTQLFECAYGDMEIVQKSVQVFVQKRKVIEEIKQIFSCKIVKL